MKLPDSESKFPYNTACVAMAVALALLLLAAYLHNCAEVMGSFMFGLMILWQVVRGLIIKRYFWHIADEKTTFWALIVALLLCAGMLWLCLSNASQATPV